MGHTTRGLAAATGWGGTAGAGIVVFVTLTSDLGPIARDAATHLALIGVIAAIAWVVACLVVFGALVLIALPLTAVLERCDCEGAAVYAIAGALAGFAIPLAVATGTVGFEEWGPFLIAGLVAGGTAGAIWGIRREDLARSHETASHETKPDRGERWLR